MPLSVREKPGKKRWKKWSRKGSGKSSELTIEADQIERQEKRIPCMKAGKDNPRAWWDGGAR